MPIGIKAGIYADCSAKDVCHRVVSDYAGDVSWIDSWSTEWLKGCHVIETNDIVRDITSFEGVISDDGGNEK